MKFARYTSTSNEPERTIVKEKTQDKRIAFIGIPFLVTLNNIFGRNPFSDIERTFLAEVLRTAIKEDIVAKIPIIRIIIPDIPLNNVCDKNTKGSFNAKSLPVCIPPIKRR